MPLQTPIQDQYRVGIEFRCGLNYQMITGQNAFIETNCNQFIFVNQGATTAVLDNMLQIPPGSSFSAPGEIGEWYDHTFTISFTGSGLNQLILVRKYYH